MEKNRRTPLHLRKLPDYTRGEEIFNMVTHITGGALANNPASTNAAGFNTAHGFLALASGEIEAG